MSFTILEYAVLNAGQPVEGSTTRTASKAFGSSHRLASSTQYVVVIPAVDMYLRISDTGEAATTADYKVLAGDARGFHTAAGARLYLYGIAA